MKNNQFLPQIAYGTRDFLPQEAKRKRVIENRLANLFAAWDYDEVITPTFEYLETVAVASESTGYAQNMFKFFDQTNRLLVLRPEMTTPIARVASTRLHEVDRPLRLSYLASVFRQEEYQAGRQCEFHQAGVELMGVPGPAADAEVIALAVETMAACGLKDFQISLGHMQFISGLMEESHLSVIERQQIKQLLMARDLVALKEAVAASGLSSEAQQVLLELPLLHGKEELLVAARKFAQHDVSRQALDDLAQVFELLKNYGVADHVEFDLGMIRDFDYYTGIVFEGYTPGLGFPVCGGGRYDQLLASFGADSPATGFALGMERILLALERQHIELPIVEKSLYVAWTENKAQEAIQTATELRKKGARVALAFLPQSRQEAAEFVRDKGYEELIYCGD
ncbi:ATP phosphoribosyltransferase regulatory subunit [Sporomusaceae bacterium BoRhaA]|uniref:ATP phosphoribosyltransferase regulatory subunit n=1 Tax=Pelorhabdus rhamnosifermentans TaxID=2772457 RepID=UPI001C060CDD|nr:ATP phosphoribosyltransferase regulatory subunit [Pelorhabdus rhamnosifermentans]MBU2702629.1 ATP phosphoribosyltransferase regulatory subunit [Pelorhabdus rhamnosifermentans]